MRPKLGINDLPIEILTNIFLRVTPLDLCSALTVCKRWNQAIQDKHTWTGSFARQFGSRNVFLSVSGSAVWMTEYFTRLQVYKQWRKGVARHTSFQVLSDSEFPVINRCLVDFHSNRMLTFARGDIAICNLRDGKSVTYIPGNHAFFNISAYSVSWDYLLLGKETGGLYLKNLKTSTLSTTSRTSVTALMDDSDTQLDPITCTALNSHLDKFRKEADCIAGTILGVVKFWNIAGVLLRQVELHDPLVELQSDFQSVVVALSLHKLYLIDLKTYVVSSMELDVTFSQSEKHRLFMDVDFGDHNVILSYKSSIRVISLAKKTTTKVKIPPGVTVMKATMQTTPDRMSAKREVLLAGSDGLLYANILSNDTVIVWNVRDGASTIIPQCTIEPNFTTIWPEFALPAVQSSAIALNSSVIAVGGLNGYTILYNATTGQFVRHCSVKFPKKMSHLYHSVAPVSDIILSPDQTDTQGAIVCMDAVQHFAFGDHQTKAVKERKKVNIGPSNKQVVKQRIRDGMEDYDRQQQVMWHEERLVDKYNGHDYDVDEELSVALAISQSILSPGVLSGEWTNNTTTPTEGSSMDEDEQLKIALEKSLYEV